MTNALIAGSATRAFAQPTLTQANRLFQQRLSFGSLGLFAVVSHLKAREGVSFRVHGSAGP